MRYIQLATNQHLVKINKAQADKYNPYCIINAAALQKAMSTLKPNTFKLWAYLSANQNEYEFAFSSSDFRGAAHMSYNTYKAAWQELKDKGYLIWVDELRPSIGGYIFQEGGTE